MSDTVSTSKQFDIEEVTHLQAIKSVTEYLEQEYDIAKVESVDVTRRGDDVWFVAVSGEVA